jgi:hypothetical protein
LLKAKRSAFIIAMDDTEEETKTHPERPRQWIYDRVNRNSKHDVGESKPPCFFCFPPPCLKCFPWLLEENCICTGLGRIRCLFSPDNNRARTCCLGFGFFANFLGFLATIYAALSLSESFDLIRLASFSSGDLKSESQFFKPVSIDLGLRAIALDNPNTAVHEVIRFDQLCDISADVLGSYMDPDDCAKCADVSSSLVISLIVAVVAYVPTLATDVLRMYSNYDVNCQKMFATVISFFSLAGSTLAYLDYTRNCFGIFFEGEISFNQDGEVVDPDSPEAFVVVDFDWSIGIGLICLFTGLVLKLIDILCNCCIPTPTITRNLKEQEDYEQLAMEMPRMATTTTS